MGIRGTVKGYRIKKVKINIIQKNRSYEETEKEDQNL